MPPHGKDEPRQRPNPGDPGAEVPDPRDTRRVDPQDDDRIPADQRSEEPGFERVDGPPGPNDEGQGAAGTEALDRLDRR
jgi:hypothetical protein